MSNNYRETFRGLVYPWHCDHQGYMNLCITLVSLTSRTRIFSP